MGELATTREYTALRAGLIDFASYTAALGGEARLLALELELELERARPWADSRPPVSA